ncbi:hypothetical protein WB401_13160 [Streptomyces brasiliscabiei]|uniref:Uncharacterized protein n=1 Tax=Streptomyces brasiliscabiei TaxID=2736302 RepID=A0ABU8GLN9_9ACTN
MTYPSDTAPDRDQPAAEIAAVIGAAMAASGAGGRSPADTAEILAITDAMVRLLIGVPLRSDGQLTIKSLAAEAGLKRNKLTHKHTGLKDLFYALVRAQRGRPHDVGALHREHEELKARAQRLREERDDLVLQVQRLVRVVQVLELENEQLRQSSQHPVVLPLPRR